MNSIKLRFSKGFTLVELLIVITILGLLASMVLAALQDSREIARDSKRIQEAKQLQNALELYRNANGGVYPCPKNGVYSVGRTGCGGASVFVNDGNLAVGGIPRRDNFATDIRPYIVLSDDVQLSGSVSNTYPNIGSLHYMSTNTTPTEYSILVFRESSATPCVLWHDGSSC